MSTNPRCAPGFILSPEHITQLTRNLCGPDVEPSDEVIFLLQHVVQLNLTKIVHLAINLAHQRGYRQMVQYHNVVSDPQSTLPYAVRLQLQEKINAGLDSIELLVEDVQMAAAIILQPHLPPTAATTPIVAHASNPAALPSRQLQTAVYNAGLKRQNHNHNMALHKQQVTHLRAQQQVQRHADLTAPPDGQPPRENLFERTPQEQYPHLALGLAGGDHQRKALLAKHDFQHFSDQIRVLAAEDEAQRTAAAAERAEIAAEKEIEAKKAALKAERHELKKLELRMKRRLAAQQQAKAKGGSGTARTTTSTTTTPTPAIKTKSALAPSGGKKAGGNGKRVGFVGLADESPVASQNQEDGVDG